ncbi:MAG: DNA primase [Prevotellaceae bacterium]|jgi:DNA primase|nr:DNA primase [Prevotellaceae bacterium]
MLDPSTIDRIFEAAKIEEVVADYVTLRRRGVNLIGLCPFHNEKTPSFTVSPAKNICKCFGCGKGGNPVNFIMELEQLSYPDALRHLAKKYNIEIVEKELSPEEISQRNDRESMLVLNDFARNYFSTTLHEHIDGKSIGMSYFRERGFNEDIVRKFQLGYSLDQWNAFADEALRKGYKKEYLLKTGLCFDNDQGKLTDRFRGRVMFPVHSLSGKVVAFGGRILKKDDKSAKYVNSPESEIYHKSNELYGIFFAKQAIVKHDRCFLVEGYTDVISMHQAGIENVVSSSGTSLTQGQIRLIHRFTPNITMIYDGDAAGIKASVRGIDMLLEEGMNIKVVLLPEGEDPDSFAKKQNASDFIAYIEQNAVDFIRFKTNLLLEDAGNDPIKRAALISDIVRSIAVIPDNIVRSVYIKECSGMMAIDEKVLVSEVAKIRTTKLGKEYELRRAGQTTPNSFSQPSPVDIPEETTESSPVVSQETVFGEEERHILRYVVRYGERVLFSEQAENGETLNVKIIDFVCQDLEADELYFSDALNALVLSEAKGQAQNPHFIAERFFLNHPNPAVSRLALDLVEDKHTLSRSNAEQIEKETDRLHELVPRALYEFKNKVLLQRIKDKILEMKTAEPERIAELMTEISDLNRVKAQLSKTLGERIIIRL